LTAAEYRETIAALGLTQAGAAKLLGVDARTSRRWALGEREVPPPVSRLLLFILRSGATPEDVMRVLQDPD
jgi:transcriptional regulator with XRE-family HTH domain